MSKIGVKQATLCYHLNLKHSDPPPIDPTIQQTPNRPVNAGERVVLACSVSGGHPLPALTWNCSGNITDRTSGSTVFHTVVFMSAKEDNGKICACSATHPVTAYRPVVSLKLDVNCMYMYIMFFQGNNMYLIYHQEKGNKLKKEITELK